ncbi:MAG: hypothetical protein U0176_24470 [Bacteroidia bacterium]
MDNFQDDRMWRRKWARQLDQTQRRLHALLTQQSQRLAELERAMEEVNALRALVRLYKAMIDRTEDEPP